MKNNQRKNYRLLLGLLGFSTLLVYLNSMHGEFHFDDKRYILENYAIRDIANWREVLRNQFRPLLWGTYLLNHHFVEYRTFGWHVVNLAMHLLNTYLVFFLVSAFLKDPASRVEERQCFPMALATAFLFGLHPIQTESVSYISSRSELMVANFYFGSLLLWAKHRRLPKRHATRLNRFSLLAAVLFLMGLYTKESMITLPVVLVLWQVFLPDERLKKGKGKLAAMIPLIPFFVLFLAWFVYRHQAIGTVGNPESEKIAGASVYHWTQARVVCRYLVLLLMPIGQNIDPDIVPSQSFLEWRVMGGTLLHLSLLGLAIRYRKTAPIFGLGIFWFYTTVGPTSSFVALRDAMAEHRIYLPALGIFWIMVLGVFWFAETLKKERFAWGILTAFIIIFGCLTVLRNNVYRDGVALWSDTIEKSPNKARPHYNLGNAYFNAEQYEKALTYYTRAIELKPRYLAPRFNRGNTYNVLEQHEKALADYEQVLNLNPVFFRAIYNMGVVLGKLGEYERAVMMLKRAIQLRPDFVDSYNSIGVIYYQAKRFEESAKYFTYTLKKRPQHLEALLNLASSYFLLEEFEKAEPAFEQAIKRKPRDFKLYVSLALCRIRLGRDTETTEKIMAKALSLQPKLADNAQFQNLQRELKIQTRKM